MMTCDELIEIVKGGENSRVQFKERFSTPKQMAEEIAAFANGHGGIIVVGVNDKTGEIEGLDYQELQDASSRMGNAAHENVRPSVYVQTETVLLPNGKAALVVHVEEGTNKPYKNLSGDIYVKEGCDKRRVTDNEELLRLFHQSGRYFPDEETLKGASVDDLDRNLIETYITTNFGKSIEEMDIPYENLLKNIKVLGDDGHVTLAGLLFFGKNPQREVPAFNVKAVAFYGNDMGGLHYRDSRDIDGTLPQMFEQSMHFIKNNLHFIQGNQSFNSLGKLEIPEVALAEILQNALVHREYIASAPIRILIFDNRLEIISPGALPSGMSVDLMRFGNSKQRNRLLASFCSKSMDYRGLGTGVLRAISAGAEMKFENSESANTFKVIFKRPGDLSLPSRAEDPATAYTSMPGKNLEISCPALRKKEINNAKAVLEACKTPKSLIELMDVVDYTSRTSFRRNILIPLLEAKLIEGTIKDKPNSPKQTYVRV